MEEVPRALSAGEYRCSPYVYVDIRSTSRCLDKRGRAPRLEGKRGSTFCEQHSAKAELSWRSLCHLLRQQRQGVVDTKPHLPRDVNKILSCEFDSKHLKMRGNKCLGGGGSLT